MANSIKPAALAALLLCCAFTLAVQAQAAAIPVPPPPMGWSSWNSFSNTVDSQVVMNQAKAVAANGMQKAGYQYINIDEGWWLGQRDAEGNIVVDAKAWPPIAEGEQPGDMGNIVRYIHGLGLKAGIYTDAGADGCSTVGPDLGPSYPRTGSEGHYEQDFLQFAKWGFDYVKVDWCGGDKENLDPAIQYAEIARAIAHTEAITGHRLYFSICNWGKHSPWTWAPNIGGVTADVWRTGGDIVAPIVAGTKNADRKASFKEVLREFDQAQHPEAQHSGFYNDPDMMVVGMPGLTNQESRAHMSLWAISGGPLLVGADLTRLSATDLATLTNPDVLRIDQDSLGLQCVKVAEPAAGLEVWAKPLTTIGERAVLLLNRSASPGAISVAWRDLGLSDGSSVTVRDAWTGKDLGEFASAYSATVPAGDAVLLFALGSEGATTAYFPEQLKAAPASGQTLALGRDKQLTFAHVASRFPIARIRITYTNPDKTARFAELRVNGRIATRIAFPQTGGDGATGTLSIESPMETGGAKNILAFSVSGDPGPVLQSISLQ
ncbi:alpha-galactosidase [Acidicapsa acidisoli]|uniref:alpha-galactosidase n=1 Tax=Acidicapsa acidisoli TaxID=1615681 RepID=UPI0021DF4A8B|nr:alpha-galactosidase [Acidicapsa acidisoli]